MGNTSWVNPAADKSLVVKWRRVEGPFSIHRVSNRASLALGDFSVIEKRKFMGNKVSG